MTEEPLVARLAVFLASYENDEPLSWDTLVAWRDGEHCGDCTNQPAPCLRCEAEEVIFKATWMAERLDL